MAHEDQPDGDGNARRRRYITREQLVADTGLSVATVQRLKRSGKIPFFQPGGPGTRVLFPTDAIEAAKRPGGTQASHANSTAAHAAETGPNPPTETTGSRELSGPRPRWQTSRHGATKET